MKEIAMKLGCAIQKEPEVSFGDITPRRILEYQLHDIFITRPIRGTVKQRIICPTCNKDVFIKIRSLRTTLLMRFTAVICIIIPLAVLAAFLFLGIKKDSALIGFFVVIFLAPLCMIPFFLPHLFKKEHKLAFTMKNPRDLDHRLFEENIESVTSEVYY